MGARIHTTPARHRQRYTAHQRAVKFGDMLYDATQLAVAILVGGFVLAFICLSIWAAVTLTAATIGAVIP